LTCSIGHRRPTSAGQIGERDAKARRLDNHRPRPGCFRPRALPVKELCGIGRNVEKRLADSAFFNLCQLGRYPVEVLKRRFWQSMAKRSGQMGRGSDDSGHPAAGGTGGQSVGHSMTCPRRHRREGLLKYLLQLAEMVGSRRGAMGDRQDRASDLRYGDFTTVGRQQTRTSRPTRARQSTRTPWRSSIPLI